MLTSFQLRLQPATKQSVLTDSYHLQSKSDIYSQVFLVCLLLVTPQNAVDSTGVSVDDSAVEILSSFSPNYESDSNKCGGADASDGAYATLDLEYSTKWLPL